MSIGIADAFHTLVRDSWAESALSNLYSSRYKAAAVTPVVEGSIVFLEVRDKSLSDNFRLLRAAIERRRSAKSIPYTVSVICIREGIDSRTSVLRSCLKAIPLIASAQFVFIDGSSLFLDSLPLRKETTVIQTWYACGAFKRFGNSLNDQESDRRKRDRGHALAYRNQSYVTVSASEVVWAYAEAFHMEDRIERILPIGVSRTDMFFSSKYREKACEKAAWILRRMAPELFLDRKDEAKVSDSGLDTTSRRAAYARLGDVYSDQPKESALAVGQGIVPGKKVILYAPTFRGTESKAVAPNRLDIPLMKRELGSSCILLINHHPLIKEIDRPKIPDDCRDFAFDMSDRLSIEELLTASDVCITDYSSIIFEYSLFERPLLFFAYDMQEYLDERGFFYPIREMMPGPICSTTQELTEILKTPGAEFDLVRVREFKYRFMSGCDGHATARIMQLMDRISEKNSNER